MKIQILGTAAYERVPAMFCNCPICTYTRQHGGKDLRTQAQTLINDDLLVDFGQDNYLHAVRFGIDCTRIRYILVTHAHSDHFMPGELIMARKPYGHNEMPPIQVYGGNACREKFLRNEEASHGEFIQVEAYQTFEIGGYQVTALPAHHGTEDPFVYIIQQGNKTLLYDHDSGIPTDEVYDFIAKGGYRFDMVIGDCTNADLHFDFPHGHKSLLDNERHRERLMAIGAVDENTRWVVTHFSHNGLVREGKPLPHAVFSKMAEEKGMLCAYDGIELEI